MKLIRLAGACKDLHECPAIDLTDQGTLVFTGLIAIHEELRAGPGEQSVELSAELVKEAIRVLDAR